jgi:hypothetical protein
MSDYRIMVSWGSNWPDFLLDAGNAPGTNQGDVVVELAAPVAGMESITVPSGQVTAQLSGGQLTGLTLTLADGRRMLVPWANVLAISDAPLQDG